MKSRSTLVLTEIILMVLVFFVSAALCVNAFVKADALEKKSELRDRALFEMQNVIETLKNSTDGVDTSPDSAVGPPGTDSTCQAGSKHRSTHQLLPLL